MLLPFLVPLVLAIAQPTELETRQPPPEETGADDETEGIAVAVQWSGVRATDGCFFFSGPAGLGRDDALGEAACVVVGPRPAVDFGGARFTGAPSRMTRRSTHTYNGAWTANEALTGALAESGGFSGTYSYAECGPGGPCPGTCRIEASVTFTPIGRCGGPQTTPRPSAAR